MAGDVVQNRFQLDVRKLQKNMRVELARRHIRLNRSAAVAVYESRAIPQGRLEHHESRSVLNRARNPGDTRRQIQTTVLASFARLRVGIVGAWEVQQNRGILLGKDKILVENKD